MLRVKEMEAVVMLGVRGEIRVKRSNSLIFAQVVVKDEREKPAIKELARPHPLSRRIMARCCYIIKGTDCLNGLQF